MSNIRAFTFSAYNSYELQCDLFFQIRSVVAPNAHLEAKPDQEWNRQMQGYLRAHPQLKQLTSDPKHPLVAPGGIQVAVAPKGIEIGICRDGMRLMPELYDQLELGSLSPELAGLRIKEGRQLKLTTIGGQGLDGALQRVRKTLRPPKPLPNIGVQRSERFKLSSGEMRPCSIRVDCPSDSVTVLDVEQWRVGINGDLHRPMGHLLFLFPAEGQLEQLRPLKGPKACDA